MLGERWQIRAESRVVREGLFDEVGFQQAWRRWGSWTAWRMSDLPCLNRTSDQSLPNWAPAKSSSIPPLGITVNLGHGFSLVGFRNISFLSSGSFLADWRSSHLPGQSQRGCLSHPPTWPVTFPGLLLPRPSFLKLPPYFSLPAALPEPPVSTCSLPALLCRELRTSRTQQVPYFASFLPAVVRCRIWLLSPCCRWKIRRNMSIEAHQMLAQRGLKLIHSLLHSFTLIFIKCLLRARQNSTTYNTVTRKTDTVPVLMKAFLCHHPASKYENLTPTCSLLGNPHLEFFLFSHSHPRQQQMIVIKGTD